MELPETGCSLICLSYTTGLGQWLLSCSVNPLTRETAPRTHWLEVPQHKPKEASTQILQALKPPWTVSCVFSLDLSSAPQDYALGFQSQLVFCTPGMYLVFSASAGPLHPRKTTQTQYSKHLCALPFGGLAGSCAQRPSKLRRQHLPPVSEHPCAFFSTPDIYPFFCQQSQIMSVMLKFTHVYL